MSNRLWKPVINKTREEVLCHQTGAIGCGVLLGAVSALLNWAKIPAAHRSWIPDLAVEL